MSWVQVLQGAPLKNKGGYLYPPLFFVDVPKELNPGSPKSMISMRGLARKV